jgi:hypothetical protein
LARLEQREGHRAGLLEPVALGLVGDGQVGGLPPEPQLPEDPRALPSPLDPVALLGEAAGRQVAVERPEGPGHAGVGLAVPPAGGLQLSLGLQVVAAAAGDDVDGASEGVAPEDRARAADDLDALDLGQRDEIEVDLLRGRLVEPHPVEEDADPLRQPGDRADHEAPHAQVLLEPVPLLVAEVDAGELQQHLLHRPGAAALQLLALHGPDDEAVGPRAGAAEPGGGLDRQLLDQRLAGPHRLRLLCRRRPGGQPEQGGGGERAGPGPP